MYKNIIYREFKKIKYKQLVIIFVLLTIFLLQISIFKLLNLNAEYNLNTKNLENIISAINTKDELNIIFQAKIITYSFLAPIFIYFFYLGFPNLLQIYKDEKNSKNMYHLLTTPCSIKGIVRSISCFATIITIIPSILELILVSIIFKCLGVYHIINLHYLIVSFIIFIAAIYAISFLITSILWITNCNKFVYFMCKFFILLGMFSLYIVLGKDSNLSFLFSYKFLTLSIISSIFTIMIGENISSHISKEKIFLSEIE